MPVASVWFVARRALVVFLVAGAAFTSVGCGRAHLFYDTRELRHAPIEPRQETVLVRTVAEHVKGRRVVWVDAEGQERAVEPDEKGLAKLGTAELGALWLTTATGDTGGESDVRVRVARKGATPVTVVMDLEGNIRVITGRDVPEGPAPSEAEIKGRFDLDSKLPGKWADDERRALTEALGALSPDELALVKNVGFDREARSRDGDTSRAALYEMKGCVAKISLFSTGVRSDRFRFVGNADAPRSAVLHALVHEIGHAFEMAPARRKYCAAARVKGAKANDLVREGNDLVEGSAVLREYREALAGLPAPTDYGNASLHESFAESFALFHVDPDALRRTRPGVHAWFKANGHVRALKSDD